jgi:hypothetical protein
MADHSMSFQDTLAQLGGEDFEKLAGSFAAFIKLACSLRYLRELLGNRSPRVA